MKRTGLAVLAAFLRVAAAAAQTPDEPAAAIAPVAAVALPAPTMSGPLAFSSQPPSVNVGPLGTWYLDGVASGLGLLQSRPVAGDRDALADVSNAQLILQKTDGVVRFYVQAGAYALPALGESYTHQADTRDTWRQLFGPVPQAFIKIAPTDAFSIQFGKLPTLIGAEGTFTFQDINIARGLLWNQEPAVSRGVQLNYIIDPLAFSLSLNDGFYSGRYSWVSGSATWNVNAANVLVFAAGGNLASTGTNTLATPQAQNNSSIYNLIYTYTHGPLTVTPYLQYTRVAPHPTIGIMRHAATYGGAVLASYAVTKSLSLGARVEYEASSSGYAGHDATNLLYGSGSSVGSFTLTPTYTLDRWFVRDDLAVLAVGHAGAQDGFGRNGNAATQFRALLEFGYIF